MMIRRFLLFTGLSLFFSFSLLIVPKQASAANSANWRAGRIIDDGVFTNRSAMSVYDVQSFLNAKVGTASTYGTPGVCDTNGEKTSELGGGTRAQYGASHGNPAPFTCLKDYYEVPKTDPGPGIPANNYGGAPIPAGAKSAAQIIWDAAQRYNISPKVLLVTIQKESAGPLITDDWPFRSQYTYAMGARCPDTSGCDSNYAGFSMQINESARLLRYYLDNMGQSWWSYKKPGNNSILYNPNTSCGSSNVYIETKATAALYTYTPYQPNQAALNNLYGTGDSCSAYGNRNFWRMFIDWFGSTSDAPYSWQLINVSYSTGGPTFVANQAGTVTVTVKNTGTVSWFNHGANPVNLATWNPTGHNSPLYSPGWLSPNTLANINEGQVDPGGTATFTIPINTSRIGTFVDSWNLVVQNSQWMEWQGLSPTINIVPAYAWQVNSVIYGNGTGVMIPGTQQLITVKATNTGAATWSNSSGPPIQLATWGPGRVSSVRPASAPKNWLSASAVTGMNQSSVAPGQQADFQFYVEVPSSGYFYEHFNLVAQGQQWFNDPGLTLYLKGGTYSWQPISTPYNTGATDVNRGQTVTITVNVKNTGDVTWYNTSPWPIDIATDQPQGRGSILYNSNWLTPTTPATLQQSSVAPSQTGTFIFPVTISPNAATGVWNEHFNLVAQGLTWLNNPGFYLYFNVH